MTNIADLLTGSARAHPHRVALQQDEAALSYTQLDERSAAVGGWAAGHGVRPGDRVCLMLPNVIEFAVIYYGLLRAGAVVVPMNPLLRIREIMHYLTDSGAKLLLAEPESEAAPLAAGKAGVEYIAVDPAASPFYGAEPSRQVVARDGDDTAVLLYTSGTTGTPKGAELTHASLLRNAKLSGRDLLRLTPEDVVLGCLPLFHVFGQTCALNAAIDAGATLTLLPRFDAGRVMDIFVRDRVTVFAGVPTMYSALLQIPNRHSARSLRLCVSGGSALPLEVLHSFEDAYGIPVFEGYGLSETSPVAAFNIPGSRKPGSAGKPVDGVAIHVLDRAGAEVPAGEVGELTIKGHNVMKGYWRNPEATEAAIVDGWFRTGDLGRADTDGYLYIVGRTKDMIIRTSAAKSNCLTESPSTCSRA